MNHLLAFALIALLCVVGPALDGPSDNQAAIDIEADLQAIDQQAMDMNARIERHAARVCRDAMGPSATHGWTADNTLTCTAPPVTQGAI